MKTAQLKNWYETLSPATLTELSQLYHEEAEFIDPFNTVKGHDEITAVFQHMFETTVNPKFQVLDVMTNENTACFYWDFQCVINHKPTCVLGMSRLTFADDGRVKSHHDYWDSAELLAPQPVIGTILRVIKNKLQARQHNRP